LLLDKSAQVQRLSDRFHQLGSSDRHSRIVWSSLVQTRCRRPRTARTFKLPANVPLMRSASSGSRTSHCLVIGQLCYFRDH
jgi:hypothetical protein